MIGSVICHPGYLIISNEVVILTRRFVVLEF